MGKNKNAGLAILGFFLLVTLVSKPIQGTDLMLQIDAGREECFYENVDFNKTLYVDYNVVNTNQGELDINFQISDTHGRPILTEFRKSESRHEFPINKGGYYRLCFDNTFSHFSHKTVAFHVSVDSEDDTQWKDYDQNNFLPDGVYDVQVNDIKTIMERVRVSLNKIEGVQDQFRMLELRDRSIAESNFERVNFWSLVYLFVVFFVGLIQVFLLKSLFDDKYSVRKFISKMNG